MIRAYLQLLRAPNVFTALADVLMGFLLTRTTAQPAELLGLLLATSALLYLAGMVLNDVFDREIDAAERPSRPIPSGRVSVTTAQRIGWGMLLTGVCGGWGAGYLADDLRPGAVACVIAALVVLYDVWLKATPLAPIGMGGCRFLNVLLGMSCSPMPWGPAHLVIASGVGLYIVGVTLFSRGEATTSSRPRLIVATAAMLCGIGLLACFPHWDDAVTGSVRNRPLETPANWLLFWGLMAAFTLWRCSRAITDTRPAVVQSVVRNSIMALIFLDAGVLMASGDMNGPLVVLALLVPALLLGRWIYST